VCCDACRARIEGGVRAYQLECPVVAVALVIAEFARARLAPKGCRVGDRGRVAAWRCIDCV